MKTWLKQFASEDWIIVFAGAVILALVAIFPGAMPKLPSKLTALTDWVDAGYMFLFVLILTYVCSAIMGKPLKGIFISLLFIFALTLLSNLLASLKPFKTAGIETVFFAVCLGLICSNCFKLPKWLLAASTSEFYIKIGIICLGSTIMFGEMMKSGAYGLAQSLIIVFSVWYFCFWVGKKMKVDPEMGTMLSSAVSICGVSAAIATCGVIKGDNKKLSYVISIVLIIAIPMMFLIPWLANIMQLPADVAGAWIGGTIDTTAAVAAAGNLTTGALGEQTAVIVKASQNVLLGVAAFFISMYWAYKGTNNETRPSAGLIWDRFPKFVIGMILASLVFSLVFDYKDPHYVNDIKPLTKSFQTVFFSIAFVCIGLETRLKEIFNKENRVPLKVFLTAQTFNIFATLLVAYVIFGIIKPAIEG
jgi:uncharacterized integral membrane protein (TIGR00698 family)